LSRSRARVQDTLVDLHEAVASADGRALLEQDPNKRGLFGLLLGTAFSLWRAAFLSHGAVTWPENLKQASEFLDSLIGDNAIAYVQDRQTGRWTSGYYLNNARYRLKEAYARVPVSQTAPQQAFRKLDEEGLDLRPRDQSWDTLCDSLQELLVIFKGGHSA
jgi:hypothetical protein